MGRVFDSLDDPEFNRFFVDFGYTAFRLETLQVYGVPYEQQEFVDFMEGRDRGVFPGIDKDWIVSSVVPAVESGKRLYRVHVIKEPLTDYVRFECAWAYRYTVKAGEDIRILPVSGDDWPQEIPHYDFWLFDSSQLVEMYYKEDGTFTHAEMVDDPRRIVRANLLRDVAVAQSIPFEKFSMGFDEQFRRR